MKIIDVEDKEKSKKKDNLYHEVSLGSNELFNETTKEKREESEHKLLYEISEKKTETCVETAQEQYNFSVNTQPQNIENQVQPVVPQQNAIVQGNQNGMISTAFSQRGEQKERHRHQYSSMVFDDAVGYITYVVKVHVNALTTGFQWTATAHFPVC